MTPMRRRPQLFTIPYGLRRWARHQCIIQADQYRYVSTGDEAEGSDEEEEEEEEEGDEEDDEEEEEAEANGKQTSLQLTIRSLLMVP